MQCPRCEGSGKCQECKGEGFVACVGCQGSGTRSSSRGGSYPCRNCSGSGKAECSPICASCEGSGQITAELQERVRDKYRTRFDNTSPLTAMTSSLVALCVTLYLVEQLSPGFSKWVGQWLSNYSELSWRQPWRLLSSAFVHLGFMHLALNMLTLLRYGPTLEGFYGTRRFTLAYVLCALGGSATSALAAQVQQHPTVSMGASGAIFGLFGILAGAHFRYHVFDGQAIRNNIFWLVVYTGWFWASNFAVDHWCHLGGFLVGLVYGYLTGRPRGH
jgi:membrane associated rhomboid family serine protease